MTQPVPTSSWVIDVVDTEACRRIPIAEGESLEIGSGLAASVRVQDPAVSSRHCGIGLRGGRLVVEDLGSRNGMYIGGGGRVARLTFVSEGSFVVGRTLVTCAPRQSEVEDEACIAPPLDGVLGQSRVMRRLAHRVRSIAPLRAAVLVCGETGSGKELVALALHQHSKRKEKPFLPLNMGALPGELADAELFGHERGAFTGAVSARLGAFQAAQGGTLFLDEVAELPLPMQAKLLRTLENGEVRPLGSTMSKRVDVRVVAATWAALDDCVVRGTFREDLFHRLAVLKVMVPSLRERRTDIPLLASRFLGAFAADVGDRTLSPHALARLVAYRWPGNVRELKNVLLRAALEAPGSVIGHEHVNAAIGSPRPDGVPRMASTDRRAEVRATLASAQGNVSRAARELGIARSTVRSWGR